VACVHEVLLARGSKERTTTQIPSVDLLIASPLSEAALYSDMERDYAEVTEKF
jgi:hypothetical protein